MEAEVKKEVEEKEKEKERPRISRIDIKKENVATWLVKVPHWLGDLWSNQSENTDLGQVKIIPDPNGNNEAFLYLPDNTESNVPCKVFRMNTANIFKPMKIFSEDMEGNVCAEGFVKYKFDLEPVDKTKFRNSLINFATLKDPRNSKNNLPKTQVKTDVLKQYGNKHGFTNTLTGDKRKRDPQSVPERRERLEQNALMEIIFSCFEEKEFWTLKELNDRCKQPEKWLKEVLAQVCQFTNKGQTRKMYELKPEYSSKPKQPGDDDKGDSE